MSNKNSKTHITMRELEGQQMQESDTKVKTAAPESSEEQEKPVTLPTSKTSTKAHGTRQTTPRPRAPKNQEPKLTPSDNLVQETVAVEVPQKKVVVRDLPAQAQPEQVEKAEAPVVALSIKTREVSPERARQPKPMVEKPAARYESQPPRYNDERQPEARQYDNRSYEQQPSNAYIQSQENRSYDGGRGYYQNNQSSQGQQPRNQERNQDQYAQSGRQYDRDSGNQPAQPYRQEHRQQQNQDFRRVNLAEMSLTDLNVYARRFGIIGASLMSKEDLVKKITYIDAHPELEMEVSGVLEKLPDGFGFLRSASFDYVSGPDDVYVSPSQIRRFNLRTGDTVVGVIRKPKEGEKYFALLKISSVNGQEPMTSSDRPHFDRLSPLHPNKKFNLESSPTRVSSRIMDIFTPIGKGQRGLIVAPPKVGKTELLKELAQTLIANHPEAHLIILCVDERPEEVADMKRT
ncbi:MAG: hypothetical protein P4L31_00260, partial [Candidatus Babeliales bacterium]|nr:hypothetical protein [Candidatus Babeliales bacterium]